MTPELALATFDSRIRLEDVPGVVVDRTKELLLDAIASALTGRATVEMPAMEAVARALAGDGGATTVIGGRRLTLAGATLLNGYEITAATICDVHRPILCHVTPVVVPPALAVAEREGSDGPTLLAALIAGFETTVRIGLAMDYPRFRSHGWHSPGVVGPFGGAAAVARLLGLDPLMTRHALGFAGSQAAGTFAALGSAQVKFHQARGALSGLISGLVAAEGLDSAEHILTAPDGGLLSTYSDGGLPARLTDDLGNRWELMGISLRRWPAASSLQAVVQAALDVRGTFDHPVSEIQRLSVALPEGSFRLNGTTTWHDQLSAFQSAAYVAAVVLADRRCWLEQFSPARIADPSLVSFVRERVDVRVDPSLPPGSASLIIERSGNPGASARVDIPPGDPAAPLSRDQLGAKLRAASAGTPLAARADAIIELVLDLDRAKSLEPLLAAIRADGGSPDPNPVRPSRRPRSSR